jgi:hypothetical protein
VCYLSKVLSRLIELEIQAVFFVVLDELSTYRRSNEGGMRMIRAEEKVNKLFMMIKDSDSRTLAPFSHFLWNLAALEANVE